MGETEIIPLACVIFAPMAFRQSIVARISSENVSHETRTEACPSAAQMRSRCACDLDAGARNWPDNAPGKTTRFIPRLRP